MNKEKKEKIFRESIIPLEQKFYHAAYRILKSQDDSVVPEDIDDIVQETMETIWKSMDTFLGQSRIETWAYGILKHKVYDHVRKVVRIKNNVHRVYCNEDEEEKTDPSFYMASDEDVLEQVVQNETLSWVVTALQRLKQEDRELIVMRFLEELSLEEAAMIQGVTVNTLSVRQNRALKRLSKEIMKIQGGDDVE